MATQALNQLFHCVFSLNVHLVLVTKYRRKCINQAMLDSLKSNCERLSNQWECKLLEFNGEPDHVHLLISMNPKVSPSIFVNNLKTVTSRLLRRDFPSELAKFYRKPVFWSRSYCILSCGGAPLSIIKQYIEQQAGVD